MFQIIKSLLKKAETPKPCERKWDFDSDTSKLAQLAALLAKRKSITAIQGQDAVNTTDIRKMFTVLRRRGYISRSEKRTNPKTGASYMVHYWSGKKPTFRPN